MSLELATRFFTTSTTWEAHTYVQTYVVYNTYVTTPEDSKHLERDTQGKREITLTTCTDDTKSRIIILAKEQ